MRTGTKKKLSRQNESARKRELMLDVASTCFGELGYKATTTREIARRSGVSDGLLFAHFASKEALFEAAVEQVLAHWWDMTQDILDATPDVIDALEKLFRAGFEFAARSPLYLALRRHEGAPTPRLKTAITEANRRWLQQLADLLRQGQIKGEIRRDLDTASAADLLNELQITYTTRRMGLGMPLPDAMTDTLLQFMKNGLTPTNS
ncbi:hypothetical protein B9N43_15295 [Denitratisoma sp. DHT3]|uniref:TetR/AcrR family transcriptional regulator n=1 Tax=Denitratisoma sp. DHT3 TaxID=1981880 RepID=UPI001198C929|nr:TetR/AcrR family transcriptional regulator [Denitratisoma sp. DHT3]QDX82478.1 hypothetical protein B9N43_15295 [Denitratisoma sp. DHT3]